MRDLTRAFLDASGLSQHQLARRAGISPGTLSRYLRGERAISARTRRRLIEEVAHEILARGDRSQPDG